MRSIRQEAYERFGISDSSQRYLLIAAPKAGCIWSGRAQLGGPESRNGILVLHDSADSYVITHELGHTFGLGHTNFYDVKMRHTMAHGEIHVKPSNMGAP